MTTEEVLVSSQAPGISCVSSNPHFDNHCLSLAAKAFIEITLGRPFYVLVSKVGHTLIHIPKHMSIDVDKDPPERVVKLVQDAIEPTSNEDRNPSHDEETVAEVTYNPAKDRASEMKRHAKVKMEDALRKEED